MVFGPNRRVARRTARRVARRQAMFQQDAYPEEAPEAQPPPPAEKDAAEQLKELAALHEQGILTDEEFAAKKKQILGI